MAVSHDHHHDDTASKRIKVINSSNLVKPGEEEDHISKLHDEIIISILSRLDTIEQQTKTSGVARRWRYLWKSSSTTNLRFLLKQGDSCSEFVCRVNQVIEALGTSTNIGTFQIVFDSNNDASIYQHDIDEWLNFALQKRVKRLNLELWFYGKKAYSLNESRVMKSRIHNQSLVSNSLTSLRLRFVDVSGEVLEYILSVSALLEELFVSNPGPSLVKLTVSGWSLKLKHLEFEFSEHVEHLDIHHVNLESLKYVGYCNCLTIRDTPRMVKACFPLFWGISDMDFSNRILSNLPQLETLEWRPCPVVSVQKFPKLRNLKQLKLEIQDRLAFSIGLCSLLIDASPSLGEFKIEFMYLRESDKEDKVSKLKHPHQNLKVVEIVGFIGCEVDLGLALYLIENIASLETMIVDTHHPYSWRAMDPVMQQGARALARTYLEPVLSSQTKMIVK